MKNLCVLFVCKGAENEERSSIVNHWFTHLKKPSLADIFDLPYHEKNDYDGRMKVDAENSLEFGFSKAMGSIDRSSGHYRTGGLKCG